MPSRLPTDVSSLAKFIVSPECRSIAILTGAGVSVAAGIPDFRSPGGMYDALRPELITATAAQRRAMAADPTAVVLKDMFFANAFPYLEVRRPFILGTRERRWRATLSHRFAELLHAKTGKLTRLYTQNIDGLDYQTALPTEKIVAVHGSIGKVACEGCGAPMEFDAFCAEVRARIKDLYGVDSAAPAESTPIPCPACHRPLVKPTTVLFGSSLPAEFFERSAEDLPSVDLLLVAGTSLVVSPANSLVYRVPDSAVRAVINAEPVGQELGIRYSPGGRDLFLGGECDDTFLALMVQLGWADDLARLDAELPAASQKRLRALLAAGVGDDDFTTV